MRSRTEAVSGGAEFAMPGGLVSSWLRTVDDRFGQAATVACVATTFGFAAVMLLGVVFRYLFNSSLSWSDELGLILFGWATFLSIAVAYRHDRHVRIEFLIHRCGPRALAVLALLVEIVSGAYLICLVLSSLESFDIVARAHTAALQWPQSLPFLAIPVAAGLMLIHWARRLGVSGQAALSLTTVLGALLLAALLYAPFWNGIEVATGSGVVLYVALVMVPIVIGVPVAFALGMVAITYVAADGGMPFNTLALQMFFGTQNLTLMAIPLLILAGGVMHAAGIAERMVDFALVIVGRMRGGLASTNVLASFLFGDISGSAVSDTAAVGSAMIPQMIRHGYRPDFCAGLQGAAGTLGMLAPVSITVLLYATSIDVSVGRLAAAMILPAVLTAVSFMAWSAIHARRHGYPTERPPSDQWRSRVLRALPGLSAIVLVVGGLLGGVFTPAEIGAVLLAYVILLSLISRSIAPRSLFQITVEAAHTSGMTLLLVGASAFLGFAMARGMVSDWLVDTLTQFTDSRYVVLLLVSLVFVVLGMVLEAPAIIFGFLPAFIPLVTHAGFDLVHFGVLFSINMGIGMLVPPVALNLFVSSQIAGVSYGTAVRAALPFVAIMVIDSVLIAFLPNVALALPKLIFGGTG